MRRERRRSTEAEQALAALRKGELDAVVVEGARGIQLHRIQGPDRPFETLVSCMRQGAVALGEDDEILYCNPFLADLLSVPLEQAIGMRFSSFLHEKDRERYRKLCSDCRTSPLEEVVSLRTSRGTELTAALSISPIPGTDPPSLCLLVSDLTERERIRREQMAREAAEAANLAKDRFLALLGHELRTPLQSILGWAQILARLASSDPTVRRGIETIERNARSQARLVDDLLDLSRITSGKLNLDRKPIDLLEVVDSAVAAIAPSAERRSIRVESAVGPGEARVEGDLHRLRQIVGNLLSNAVKYTAPDGDIRVGIRVRDSSIAIEVADDGRGISPEFLPRVFDMFQQAESTTHLSTGGLGLGMSIVKQLTELHGGAVSAASGGEGKGSTFTVTLPLMAGSLPAAAAKPDPERHSLEGTRVLLVDDDSDAREVLRQGLLAFGAEVLCASGTDEAIQIAGSARPHLLVGDLAMPEKDGFDLIRELRARGFGERELPAIALSALAGAEAQKQALSAGYQVHLSKPIDASVLSAAASVLVSKAKL